MNEKSFNIGDVVVLLDADAIEQAAGRNPRSECTWYHEEISKRQGQVAVVVAVADGSFGYPFVKRDLYKIEIDGVHDYWAHPEWLDLVARNGDNKVESKELDALFDEFG